MNYPAERKTLWSVTFYDGQIGSRFEIDGTTRSGFYGDVWDWAEKEAAEIQKESENDERMFETVVFTVEEAEPPTRED